MKPGKTQLAIIIAAPLLIASLGAAVYFFWDSLQARQDENAEILHKFGFQIVPNNPYTESVGELGTKQVPATFAEEELSPVEKVIHGLLQDKESLLEENAELQSQIKTLQERIDALEHYKSTNEQFVPETLDQEMARTRNELQRQLTSLPEAERFSAFWIGMMTDAAIYEYRRFIEANRLMLDDSHRQEMISTDLVNYGFCIGNAVELAANTSDEARSVARWLEKPETSSLSKALQEDLDIVIPPCRIPLRSKLDTYLTSRIGE
ncbi:hypothetical protein ACQUQP_08220 [Marinobacterium sp. YM272]|uniref:hypothetical protein n=1 Tax=Marinobacterium sp. YM272 TaxID=3421654 RepID=UPI003D7F9DF1